MKGSRNQVSQTDHLSSSKAVVSITPRCQNSRGRNPNAPHHVLFFGTSRSGLQRKSNRAYDSRSMHRRYSRNNWQDSHGSLHWHRFTLQSKPAPSPVKRFPRVPPVPPEFPRLDIPFRPPSGEKATNWMNTSRSRKKKLPMNFRTCCIGFCC